MLTQKMQRGERERERERETPGLWLLVLYCFSSPWACPMYLGQPGVLFILPEVLTPVLRSSFVLFLRAFPFLVFQPPPFWTLFSYSKLPDVNHVLSCFSCVRLFVAPWSVTCQSPLSLGFPRQEYWSGLPFPPPGDLPNPVVEPHVTSPALVGRFFTTSATWETTCDPMELSRPEYWSGQQFPSLGDFPNPGIEPRSPTLQADSLPSEQLGKPIINNTHLCRAIQSSARKLLWKLSHSECQELFQT